MVVLNPITRGPPPFPVPLRYSRTFVLSKTAVVLSKFEPPSRLGCVRREYVQLGGGLLGRSYCRSIYYIWKIGMMNCT